MRVKLVVWALGMAAIAPAATQAGSGAGQTPAVVVPITIESIQGHLRPVVETRFNGHPMNMMIHSRADFYSQLKHHQAAAFGVTKVGGHRAYGIDNKGHVSDLGRDDGRVATLAVGEHVDRDAAVSIFEVPQDSYGMLGIGWIRRNRVIVDYRRKQATLAPTSAESVAIGKRLVREGYAALPMTYDATRSAYMVKATIRGVTRDMAVASASSFSIDSELARAAGIRHGADRGHGFGPTGKHVPDYALAEPVTVRIGGWTSPGIAVGEVSDNYGYSGLPRPADPAQAEGGDLGGEFLLKTDAVIDFGQNVLFVRNGSAPRPK